MFSVEEKSRLLTNLLQAKFNKEASSQVEYSTWLKEFVKKSTNITEQEIEAYLAGETFLLKLANCFEKNVSDLDDFARKRKWIPVLRERVWRCAYPNTSPSVKISDTHAKAIKEKLGIKEELYIHEDTIRNFLEAKVNPSASVLDTLSKYVSKNNEINNFYDFCNHCSKNINEEVKTLALEDENYIIIIHSASMASELKGLSFSDWMPVRIFDCSKESEIPDSWLKNCIGLCLLLDSDLEQNHKEILKAIEDFAHENEFTPIVYVDYLKTIHKPLNYFKISPNTPNLLNKSIVFLLKQAIERTNFFFKSFQKEEANYKDSLFKTKKQNKLLFTAFILLLLFVLPISAFLLRSQIIKNKDLGQREAKLQDIAKDYYSHLLKEISLKTDPTPDRRYNFWVRDASKQLVYQIAKSYPNRDFEIFRIDSSAIGCVFKEGGIISYNRSTKAFTKISETNTRDLRPINCIYSASKDPSTKEQEITFCYCDIYGELATGLCVDYMSSNAMDSIEKVVSRLKAIHEEMRDTLNSQKIGSSLLLSGN